MRQAAEYRLQARVKEWNEVVNGTPGYNFAEMIKPLDEGGGITVPANYQGFNYKANGSLFRLPTRLSPLSSRSVLIDKAGNVFPRGDGYWVMEVEHGGAWRRITGDIDLVAITKANGYIMTPAEKLDIYKNLQDMVGIQHGDTLNWLENAELFGPHAASLLSDHVPGAEPLVVFDPTGAARVNFINPKLTFKNAVDKQARIWYVGGYRNPRAAASHLGQLTYPMFQKSVNAAQPWLTAAGWAGMIVQPHPPKKQIRPQGQVGRRDGVPSYSVLGGKCTWQYSNASAAGLVYPNNRGGLMEWSPKSGWHDLDLHLCWYSTQPPQGSPLGSNHVLRLLPQTSLQLSSAMGATRITINGVDDADPQLDAKTTPWFKVGQTIVVDPGAGHQQIVTITGANLRRMPARWTSTGHFSTPIWEE